MQFIESYIGIFWLYQGTLICKKMPLFQSKKDDLGLYDTPFQHIEEWEDKRIYLANHPGLFGTEYQEIPRGRIVYSNIKKVFTVYADKVCLTKKNKTLIIKDFKIPSERALFKSDPHYQTFNYL